MRLLIAVPTFETISPDTFKSIYGLRGTSYLPQFDFVRGYDCARARNEICREAIRDGFDYVLMVDSDIVLPDIALECMLQERVPVVLGCYQQKNSDGNVELFKRGTFDFSDRYTWGEVPYGRFEVKGGGFGCALVDVSLLREMGNNWFRYVEYENGDVLSEDLYFCDRCARMGVTVVADGRVRCGHAMRRIEWAE